MSLDSSEGSFPDYKQDTIRGPQTLNGKEKEDLGLSTTPGYEPLRGESLPLTIDDLANLIRNVVRTTQTPPPNKSYSTSTAPQDIDRKLLSLQKLYGTGSNENKYSGVDDSLNYKLKIYYDKYELAQVPQSVYLRSFSNILTGLALTYYYQNKKGT